MATYEQKIINGLANFDIVEEAISTGKLRLPVDDVLLFYATPLTRLDFVNTPTQSKTRLIQSLETFLFSNNRISLVSMLSKQATSDYLKASWLSSLQYEKKVGLLYGYKLVEKVDDDGFVILNEKLFSLYKELLDRGREPIAYGECDTWLDNGDQLKKHYTLPPLSRDTALLAKLKESISLYKQKWSYISEHDSYKWQSIEAYQAVFDINAKDFASMLSEALPNFNLMFEPYYKKACIIEQLANVAPEDVRKAFIELYNENTNLTERVISFKKQLKTLYFERISKCRNDFEINLLDDRIISTCLMLHYPQKHFLYKFSILNKFIKTLNLSYPLAATGWDENLERYEFVCKDVKDVLLNDKELLKLHDERFGNKYGYNLLVQDFIYATVVFLHNTNMSQEKISPTNVSSSVTDRIAEYLSSQPNGETFVYTDFLPFGNYDCIRSSIVRLCKLNKLIRLCQGVYMKPGKILPDAIHLASEIARRQGATVKLKNDNKVDGIRTITFYTDGSTRRLKLSDGTILNYLHSSKISKKNEK